MSQLRSRTRAFSYVLAVGAVDLAAVHAIQRGIIPGRPVVQHALRERHTLRVRRDWQAEILQDRPALNNPVKARRWQSSGGRVDTHGAMSMVWTRESRVPVASGMRGSLCSISLSESRRGGQDSCRLTYYAHIGMCAISLKNGFATTMLRLKIVASGQIGKASILPSRPWPTSRARPSGSRGRSGSNQTQVSPHLRSQRRVQNSRSASGWHGQKNSGSASSSFEVSQITIDGCERKRPI